MPNSPILTDFQDEEGHFDFDAYHKAKVMNGDDCQVCGTMIMWGGKGYPETCYKCKAIDNPDELTHEKFIRCPKCGHKWDPYETEDYDVLQEDGGEVWCDECDYKFHVGCWVTYTLTSPPRLPDPRCPDCGREAPDTPGVCPDCEEFNAADEGPSESRDEQQ